MLVNLQHTAALAPPVPQSSGLMRTMSGAVRSLARWLETRRQLRALTELDDRLLRDVGLSREDVERACSMSFWMR
jgi:uncharacterized protein YjiS (DUF1127 family)